MSITLARMFANISIVSSATYLNKSENFNVCANGPRRRWTFCLKVAMAIKHSNKPPKNFEKSARNDTEFLHMCSVECVKEYLAINISAELIYFFLVCKGERLLIGKLNCDRTLDNMEKFDERYILEKYLHNIFPIFAYHLKTNLHYIFIFTTQRGHNVSPIFSLCGVRL